MDDTDVVETVTVQPDCTTQIDFRQATGDTIKALEARGGMDVLEHGSAPAPAAAPAPAEILPATDTVPAADGTENPFEMPANVDG